MNTPKNLLIANPARASDGDPHNPNPQPYGLRTSLRGTPLNTPTKEWR